MTAVTEDTRETTYLFQRLSVALQRGNVVSFHSTFSSPWNKCRCGLSCLVFNVQYWEFSTEWLKIIIIIIITIICKMAQSKCSQLSLVHEEHHTELLHKLFVNNSKNFPVSNQSKSYFINFISRFLLHILQVFWLDFNNSINRLCIVAIIISK